MTSRDIQRIRFVALGLVAAPLLVVGCKKKAPPPPPPPPPPAGPAMISPGIVADSMTLSAAVVIGSLPDTVCTEPEVRAMLEFADDFAAGDADALRTKLQGSARSVLDDLVESGAWQDVTSDLQTVVITSIDKPASQAVFAFDVVTGNGERNPMGWVVTQRGDMFTFGTHYVPPPIEIADLIDENAGDADSGNVPIDSSKPPPNRSPDPRRRVPTSPGGPGPG